MTLPYCHVKPPEYSKQAILPTLAHKSRLAQCDWVKTDKSPGADRLISGVLKGRSIGSELPEIPGSRKSLEEGKTGKCLAQLTSVNREVLKPITN